MLISFVVFTYNQERYIQSAVRGAFSQTYENIEFIFSDDSSTDNTYELMINEIDKINDHRIVKINRNKENIGLANHVNKIFSIASGEIIIAAAGDDVSLPERTDDIVKALSEINPRPFVIHSAAISIDESGAISNIITPKYQSNDKHDIAELAVSESIYIGATGAWNKELYEAFGDIKFENAWEDLVFGFRAVLNNRIHFIDKPLIYYRANGGISNKHKGETGLLSTLRRRKNVSKAMMDIMHQRLVDYKSHKKNNSVIENNIINKIHKYTAINYFYSKKSQKLHEAQKIHGAVLYKHKILFYACIELIWIIAYCAKKMWLILTNR